MRVGELIEANRRLEARVAELEQRLNRSSRNSSLPPSQDPPSLPPRPKKPASGRKPGGQPGHAGTNRPLLPLEQVDEVREHWPERCRACARRFGQDERIDAAAPQRRQVSELPPIAVTVNEHRLHRLRCPVCAGETRAELPAEVSAGAFGPRLQVAVATLAVRNRVSRRDTVELVGDLSVLSYRRAPSTRSCSVLGRRSQRRMPGSTSRSAPPPPSTSTRPAGACAAQSARLPPARRSSGSPPTATSARAKALLGEDFAGIACSDLWWGYNYLDPKRRQLCWAHLVRDFTAHSEGLAAQKEFGEAGLTLAGRVFEAWDEYRQGGDRTCLLERVSPLKHDLRALLEQAARTSTKTKYHRLFGKNLLKSWPALWAFTVVDGVEPTNNHAERGLRGAVIYRKLSLGSQSEHGERTIERLRSASVTCRLQKRSLFAYLTDVLSASIRGDPSPRSPDLAGAPERLPYLGASCCLRSH